MALRIKNPQVGDWDYDGACCPNGVCDFGQQTFSIGIFQWLPKSSGKGIKRGKVIKRISGLSSHPEDVYAKAEAWIKANLEKVNRQ